MYSRLLNILLLPEYHKNMGILKDNHLQNNKRVMGRETHHGHNNHSQQSDNQPTIYNNQKYKMKISQPSNHLIISFDPILIFIQIRTLCSRVTKVYYYGS